ncbi:hypothetical protein G7Y89_g1389 [Cudoniella acicularis]|uniref:Origin recognition complex subunit 2 n=1 Tax=Cudoniella acicularis TaxID=354080 RepID=A0A8H4RVD2_9HELO|nr:hypothetical protein G7Y89_g1389 [Cudoniella acicularis]
MKRRKQVHEELDLEEDDQPTPKRAKANGTPKPYTVKDDHNGRGEEIDVTSRRSSRRGRSVTDTGLDLLPDQEEVNGNGYEEDSSGDESGIYDLAAEAKADSETGISTITPKRGRPRKVLDATEPNGNTPSKTANGTKLFSTPVRANALTDTQTNGTPSLERNANRSARKKSSRTLIERTMAGNTSDNDDEEEDIAQHIYNVDEDIDVDREGATLELVDPSDPPDTPSKRKRRANGTKSRARSPTPPLEELPPHEKYFFQNRGGRVKTSDNNLSTLSLLDYEEYFNLVRQLKDSHVNNRKILQDLHAKLFSQWQFELSQDFNICIYGYGSKRAILMRFADYLYGSETSDTKLKIVVVNGYVQNLTVRDVLNTIAAAISGPGQRMGSQPAEMLESLITLLEEDESQSVTVIVHSIDRLPLRRPATQAILSRLSAHPQIKFVASADHPSFPLLWDSSLRSTYNFLFHNCTTFEPYTVEIDVVDEVNDLLGRSGRRVGGKEGVSFVLKSLPENAKNLFRVLIGEQLVALDEGFADGRNGDDGNDDNERRTNNLRKSEPGVEYRVLYQKAVEEFICSNEMNFRTLLKEFHDHQMIQSRKDALGIEMLSVPFRKEELETILEDIMS